MPTEYDGFNTTLVNMVHARAVAGHNYTRSAFVEEIAERLVGAEELQDWTPGFHEGKSRRRAVALDGWSTDELELDGSLTVIVADFRDGHEVANLVSDEVSAAFERAAHFVQESIEGPLADELEPSRPAADLANLLRDKASTIRLVRVLLITNAITGTRVKADNRRTFAKTTVELRIWDLVRLSRLEATAGREAVEIDLTQYSSQGLPALRAGIGGAGYEAWLCAMPAKILADVYDEFGSRLLEGNVRAFLTAKVEVNKGLRKTILENPEKFFAFNNGITATASAVGVVGESGAERITRIVDLQIVNGGQTTASLYNARIRDHADLSSVFVQLKLSVLPPEIADQLIPEISRFANTQNKVSAADLFANHPFHRKLEEISRRVWAPVAPGALHETHWFYERARAQYNTEQGRLIGKKRERFIAENPKAQLLTKPDMAKHHNSWACLPHVVSLGAQKNFLKFAEAVSKQYRETPDQVNDRWFQHAVAKCIIFRTTEDIVSRAPWYGRAYRANIVTYAVAKVSSLVDRQLSAQRLDLDTIWRRQRTSEALTAQLERAAELAQGVLLKPPAGFNNVTEWAKKEKCWELVRDAKMEVLGEFRAELRDVADEMADTRQAGLSAKEDDAIAQVMRVHKLAQAGFWLRAAAWSRAKLVVSDKEYGFIQTASRIGHAFIPNDIQAKVLSAAAKKLLEEGLK